MLVEHALQRFSTDNLSVMVVRFNPQKVKANTSIDIGVQHDPRDTVALSEAEMIVNEARRNSGIPVGGAALSADEEADLHKMVIDEQEEEEQETGPELQPNPIARGDVQQEDLHLPPNAQKKSEHNPGAASAS